MKSKMIRCPNCDDYTIKKNHKSTLTPFSTIECINCNCKLSIPYWTFFFYLIKILAIASLPRLFVLSNYLIVLPTSIFFLVLFLQNKMTPLRIRSLKGEKKGTLFYNLHFFLLLSFFIISLFLSIKVTTGDIAFISREYVLEDLSEISQIVMVLDESIDINNGINQISDDKLFELIMNSREAIHLVQHKYRYYYSLSFYIEVELNEGLLLLSEQYNETKQFDEVDKDLLISFISTFSENNFINLKATYPLTINPLEELRMPEKVIVVFEDLDRLFIKYKTRNF